MATALALSAMLEGLWLRLMMGTEDVTRETAHQAASEYLASAFPKHFSREARAPKRMKQTAEPVTGEPS